MRLVFIFIVLIRPEHFHLDYAPLIVRVHRSPPGLLLKPNKYESIILLVLLLLLLLENPVS